MELVIMAYTIVVGNWKSIEAYTLGGRSLVLIMCVSIRFSIKPTCVLINYILNEARQVHI